MHLLYIYCPYCEIFQCCIYTADSSWISLASCMNECNISFFCFTVASVYHLGLIFWRERGGTKDLFLGEKMDWHVRRYYRQNMNDKHLLSWVPSVSRCSYHHFKGGIIYTWNNKYFSPMNFLDSRGRMRTVHDFSYVLEIIVWLIPKATEKGAWLTYSPR